MLISAHLKSKSPVSVSRLKTINPKQNKRHITGRKTVSKKIILLLKIYDVAIKLLLLPEDYKLSG